MQATDIFIDVLRSTGTVLVLDVCLSCLHLDLLWYIFGIVIALQMVDLCM